MNSLTCTIEPDELLGLSALVELDRAAAGTGTGTGAVRTAKALMRTALADKLEQAGLPWAPSAEAASKRAAQAAAPAGAIRRITGNGKARRAAAWVAAAALAVTMWGGYTRGWPWTGFRGNNQLWNWLILLLFPVALGTIPLWIQDKDYIGKGRRVIYTTAIAAWTGLVIAGYLIPLNWTGFRGQTLWAWLNLLVLPAAVTITMALAGVRARRPQAACGPITRQSSPPWPPGGSSPSSAATPCSGNGPAMPEIPYGAGSGYSCRWCSRPSCFRLCSGCSRPGSPNRSRR